MVIGGVLGLFFINSMLNFTLFANYLKGQVLLMYGVIVIFVDLFYLALKNKFASAGGLYRAG